ncbi:DUF2971 domain-containing protein [Dorea sp. OM02-2LB]|nr:DUF2971 domain-containing protein [Dorea sp. OM02-2LB]
MNLYRIISLETFVDLLHNQRERYVRPETWDDNYEGDLFKKIENPWDRRKIIEDIYYNVCPRNYEATIDNLLKLEHGKYFVYGQCWSTSFDSDALWRIYSYNHHAIQIKTTDIRIKNLLQDNSDILYEIRKVKYDVEPEDNLMHEQVLQLREKRKIYEPFFHKRKAFKHEAEVRVLIDDTQRYQIMEMSSQGANWKIHEKMQEIPEDIDRINEIEKRLSDYMGHWKEKKLDAAWYQPIVCLNKYISGVRVHPMAEEWYVELIKTLCEEKKIKFDGKSNLYGKAEKEV